jgi:acyl-CoA dehydrogenase
MQPQALEYSIASKILGTETAFRVASQAVQIFGGNGLSKEYVIEKIFRDARAAMIEDGVNETLALLGANRL